MLFKQKASYLSWTHRSFFIAAFGTFVEYYDYALYGFAAPYLAAHFFPHLDKTTGLLSIFSIFAAGSFAKPLGAFFFGWLGDKYGRRLSLRFTMLGIIVPTSVIALLPGYDQIGVIAPVLLLFCRFLQGFFISGESDGVRLFVFESIDKRLQCFGNALIGTTAYVGIFVASLSMSMVSPAFWRAPFWLGAFLGGGVIWLRHRIPESIDFQKAVQHHERAQKSPVRNFFPQIFWTIIRCGTSGGIYHALFVFLPTVITDLTGTSINTVAVVWLAPYIVGLIAAGYAADHFGVAKVTYTGVFLTLLNLATLCIDLSAGPMTLSTLILRLCLLSVSLSLFESATFIWIMSQFPVTYRYRCVGAGHAIGSCLLSGTTPAILTALGATLQTPLVPFFYTIALCILSAVSLTQLQRTSRAKA